MARQATRTKLCLFVRGKSREDGNVYESPPLPLLLYRMCHNPQQAPSRAGTQDNISCLLPVPPPCSTSPPLILSPSPSPPYPPFLCCTHMWAHSYSSACTHSHTSPHGSLTGLGMDFFYLMWFGLQLQRQLCHSLTGTHAQSKKPYCVAVH